MSYVPQPIDTSTVLLPADVDCLIEKLAQNAHETWARQRMADGWTYGIERNDAAKEHPSLVPFEQLPESEKQYDRNAVVETLKALTALDYRIAKNFHEGPETALYPLQIPTFTKFEEYKLFADSTQQLTERRQAINQFFLTANTALFVAIAFLIADAGLRGWSLALASMPLFIVGLFVSLMWRRMIAQYKRLIAWRFEQLQAIEQTPEFVGSHRIFTKEWEFFRPTNGKEQFGFSIVEAQLPILYGVLYTLYAIGTFAVAFVS